MVKIFIDPGHGGNDPGAVANGLREKDLVLTISKHIKDLLSDYKNVEVKLSREDDRFLSLSERAKMANVWGSGYFCSVHINAGGGTGFETFVHDSRSSKSVSLQNVIHLEIFKCMDAPDRGKKAADYSVLRDTKMPAILTENLFIDNANDAKKLKDPAFLKKVAEGHVDGFVKAFGLEKKEEKVKTVSTSTAKVTYQDKEVRGFIENGTTYVAIRDVAELMNLKIVYNNESKTTKLFDQK